MTHPMPPPGSPAEAKPYLARMATEDIATVAAEAYEVVEEA